MYSYVLFFVLLVTAFITNGCCDSNTEATAVALKTSGQLRAPPALVQKIAEELKAIRTNESKWIGGAMQIRMCSDLYGLAIPTNLLSLIRTAFPQVNNVVHSAPWVVGELIAELSDAQFGRIPSEYGEVTSRTLFGEQKVLKFAEQYNPVVLAEELIKKKLVNSAEPNGIIGGGDSIRYDEQTGLYEFTLGWGDCPSGCINRHYWKFSASPSGVTLISESGTPIVSDEV